MVMAEHREGQWRELISEIRRYYHGLVSYNTYKYRRIMYPGGTVLM